MSEPDRLARRVADFVNEFGPSRLRVVADRIDQGWPRDALPAAVPVPGFAAAAARVLNAQRADARSDAELVAYLRGVAAGYEQRAAAIHVDAVWSGPSTHAVPVRATAQVLTDVVREATTELLLMTYSARPYPPLIEALQAAIGRGVRVSAVVETLQGARSAMSGPEPAAAFRQVPDVQLWHWPTARRTDNGAKMHAKIAVADRQTVFVSSANLTQSGVANNMEAGLLIRGGDVPQRVAEHIAELQANGTLARLSVGVDGEC
jgi:phosphatidylserine/phosphatidylglycerophosphate/cardiolipin synthase-like enzyme